MPAGASFQDYTKLEPGLDSNRVGAGLMAQRQPAAEPMAVDPPEDDGSLPVVLDRDRGGTFEHSETSTAVALEEAMKRALRGPSRAQESRQRGAFTRHQLAALLPATELPFLDGA